jgi:hypothetical protein
MYNNYYSKENEFNKIVLYLNQNSAHIFTRNKFPSIEKDIIADKLTTQLRNSCSVLLKGINCNAVINLGTSKDSVKTYLFIYHQEFLFPTYVYQIATKDIKPKIDEKPDGFIEYKWLNNRVLAGTIKWN